MRFEQVASGYANLWAKAHVRPDKKAAVQALAQKLLANKAIYQSIETQTKVPWLFTAAIHYRESNCNFGTYLGNGQDLDRVTTEVPKGRGPFKSFILGAVDAYNLEHFSTIDWTVSRKARLAYEAEEFNGEGYYRFNINSPYVWSFTDLYTVGKYSSDGRFDPELVDKEAGCVALWLELAELDADVKAYLEEEKIPMTTPSVTPAATPAWEGEAQKIIHACEMIVKYAPTIAPFFPPAAAVVPFLPAVEEILAAADDILGAGTDPQAILAALEKHFQNIGAVFGVLKTAVPAAAKP
jgi:lysozyme family protein